MIYNLKSQTDLSGFYIIYEGSTLLETRENAGISHLCEHLMCHSFDHLQDIFQNNGINWNAYTDYDKIVFHFTGLDDKLTPFKKELMGLLSNVKVTEEKFQTERKTVIEEYKNHFNDQVSAHYEYLHRKLFNMYGPIGSLSAIESYTIEDVNAYIQKQYARPSMIVNVSKYNDLPLDFCEFEKHKVELKLFQPAEFEFHDDNKFEDKSSLIMLWPISGPDVAISSIIHDMLGSGLNSPLYQEIREKRGLCYYVHSYRYRYHLQGMSYIATLSANENINQIIDLIEEILAKPGIYMTKKRFDIVLESLKVQARIQEINRAFNVSPWLNPSGYSVWHILNSATYERTMEAFDRIFAQSRCRISIDKKEFENKLGTNKKAA